MSPRSLLLRVKRLGFRLVRAALVRYVAAPPRPADLAGAERRVTIMLLSAWGMGGTIRAAHNLAGHLVQHGYDVELLSIFRFREEPWFGSFPAGVKATALDDQRKGGTPLALRPLRRLLRSRKSVFGARDDFASEWFTLWVDVRLARRLRRRTGFLISTRPGLNLQVAGLAPPGTIRIGLEQQNLGAWSKPLRKAMKGSYPKLDALVALTSGDVDEYDALLDGRVRLERIPNTVHDMGGPKADLGSTTILAAGRLTPQKGFDFLIPAFARVHAEHPDWHLRICGKGRLKESLERRVAEHGMEGAITLAGPSDDIPGEMAAASIYVLSSRFEGFPLVLIEAMSKGMAVVSFDCPTGPADVIEDHRNGLLIPPNDVDGLAAGIAEMIEDEELRRRCGAAAAESARDYSIDAIGPRWQELLEELQRTCNGRFTP
jgi:glycosyltransferase involved in cell wall biosynthesis